MSKVLVSHVSDVVQFSTDPDVFKSVSEGFYAFKGSECKIHKDYQIKSNISLIIIALKKFFTIQIPIEAPWINPEQYIDSHKRHSISVLAVANHRGVITYLSARWPGGVHNSQVLQESFLQDVLDRNLLGEHYIIADQGFHLQRKLLTPFPRSDLLTPPQIYYNDCLKNSC